MRKFLGNIFRFKDWVDLERTKSNTKYVESLFYFLLHPSELNKRKEQSYDKILLTHQLKETDIQKNKSIFLNLVILFIVITLAIWVYLISELIHGHYLASVTIFCVSLVPMSVVFRFYYYYAVLKHKKLNLPINQILK